MPENGYNAAERRLLRRLNSPEKIQTYLDERVRYNDAATCYSPRMVMRLGEGHCMEGALLAAAALEFHGYPPLLLDLEAVRDDDHVLALFRVDGCWGAIAKSNYAGLRYRTPIYRTIRELAVSYFEHYYNPRGEKTLRAYSRPVSLRQFETPDWRTAEEPVWQVPTHFCHIPHTDILSGHSARRRYRMDRRLFEAGRLGMVK